MLKKKRYPKTNTYSMILLTWFFGVFLSFTGLFFTSWLCLEACGILVPPPGTEPVPPAVEAQSPNHWTIREVLHLALKKKSFMCYAHRLKYMKEIKPDFYQWLPIMKMIWVSVKGTLTFCSMGPTFPHCLHCVTKLFTTGTNLFRVSGI